MTTGGGPFSSRWPISDYRYDAIVREVHDGDTVTVDLDFGMSIWHRGLHLRLFGINAPELNTPAGKAAATYLRSLLPLGQPVMVETIKDRPDKFGGRWLGILRRTDGTSLNEVMVTAGHAAPWDGSGEKPVPTKAATAPAPASPG